MVEDNKMSQINTQTIIKYLSISFFCSLSIFFAFNSNMSQYMTALLGQDRQVLSKITGNLTGTDETFDVIKVKENNNIKVEIYRKTNDENVKLINKINLPHENDGYFLFHNSSVNLALNDIDGDRLPEILAPTFDKTMSAHLNVVKYSPDNQVFFLLMEPIFQND